MMLKTVFALRAANENSYVETDMSQIVAGLPEIPDTTLNTKVQPVNSIELC